MKKSIQKQLLFMMALHILFTGKTIAQQTIINNLYMYNPVPYNSAFAVINQSGNIYANTRFQWVGIDGAPKSFLVNGSLPLEKIKASAGLILRQDKVAIETQTSVNAFFAKSIQLSTKNFLALSLNGGFGGYNINYSQLDPADPEFQNNVSSNSGTVGVGLMLYSPDKYYAGISLPAYRLGTAPNSRSRSSTIYLSAGLLHRVSEKVAFKPAALVAINRTQTTTADLSGTVYFKNLGFGLNYRTTGDFSGILSYLADNFRLMYSYQTSVSSETLSGVSGGSHEIGLSLYVC